MCPPPCLCLLDSSRMSTQYILLTSKAMLLQLNARAFINEKSDNAYEYNAGDTSDRGNPSISVCSSALSPPRI